MHRSIIRVLLLLSLVISPVFAVESPSILNLQTPTSSPGSFNDSSYFARQLRVSNSGYYGVTAGGGLTRLKPEISMSRDGVEKGKIGGQNKTDQRYNIGTYAGYGATFNQFYLGGELSAFLNLLSETTKGRITDLLTLDKLPSPPNPGTCVANSPATIDKAINHDLKMTVTQPITATLDIIPGYFLNEKRNVLFYGRFGVGTNWLKFDLTDNFGPGNNVSTSANRIRFGYRLGFGIEYFMNENYGLRLEYVYSRIMGKDDHKISDDEDKTIEAIDDPPAPLCTYTSTNAYKYLYGPGSMSIHTINLSLSIHP